MFNKHKSKSRKNCTIDRREGKHKIPMRRTSSEQMVVTKERKDRPLSIHEVPSIPQFSRTRANTYSNGVSHSAPPPSSQLSQSASNLPFTEEKFDLLEALNQISPRHYNRRVAVCTTTISLPRTIKADSDSLLIRLRVGGQMNEDIVSVSDTLTLRDLVESIAIKRELELDLDSLVLLGSFRDGQPIQSRDRTLNQPSREYCGMVIEIGEKTAIMKSQSEYTLTQPTPIFKTVRDCLAYFGSHGITELPLPPRMDENYHLPRVTTPIDHIAKSWGDLPIDSESKRSLSKREMEQQLAVWEFIATEHSYIRHLETIINIFMRPLELIRRAELLTEENYHNVFGYMEDIYYAHDQFWTQTLEPVLETVYERGTPLNLDEIISRFPTEFGTHFEIYEQHCQLEALDLHSLKRARKNSQFVTYLEWCESQPECQRLRLDQLLATPMQRLTRYPLLMTAILKKTTRPDLRQQLEHLCEEMQELVGRVNSSIRIQEETERVRDVMNRIIGVQLVDLPGEIKDLVQPHTQLDLLAPMTGVEVDRGRVLILEGTLKYRDALTSKMVPLHLFLFTDMLLITKLSSRKENKYTIIREPYKIDRLLLHPLEPGSFGAVVLNEFQVASSWFILKANSPAVATEWLVHINKAKTFYSEALERRTQHWQLIQSLQSERILDGIGQEGRDALSASLWSISPSYVDLNKRSMSGSIDSISMKCSPGIRPPRRKTLSRAKSEDKSPPLISRNNNLGLVRINSAASPGERLQAAGSLDMLLEHPQTQAHLRCTHSHSQLTLSNQHKRGSESASSSSLNKIPSSPLSQDSGTESGGTISADMLELSDEELVTPEVKKKTLPQKSHSADDTVSTESEKLKPILRNRDETQFDALKSILRREQLDIPFKPLNPLNRVKSDDSGIAIKQSLSSERQNSCSPSPCGRASVPETLSPRANLRVHFRSQSDTSTLNLDVLSPTSEETQNIASSSQNEQTALSASSPPPLPEQPTVKSVDETSAIEEAQSLSSPNEHSLSSPNSKSESSEEVKPTVTSPKQSNLLPPPVSKKPLCRLKTPEKIPPTSPVKAKVSVPPKKVGGPAGQPKASPARKKSTAGLATQSASSPAKRKQTSQLRRPSVVLAPKDFKNVSVKERKQKFESPTSTTKPPPKEEKPQTMSASKSATAIRKRTSCLPPQTHQRSKSNISPTDISNFRRQNAVRTRPHSPRTKKNNDSKQSSSLARSSTLSAPKRKISIAKIGKPPSLDEARTVRHSSFDSDKGVPTKTTKPANLDETETEPLSNPDEDKDVLTKLAALTPPRASKLPRRVSKTKPQDPKIRIEVVGGSERGIDIPLNFNSNNNESSSSKVKNECQRKPSTYEILEAVTVDSTPNGKNNHRRKPSTYNILEAVTVDYTANGRSATLPHKTKRSPIEWSHFGTSWKSPPLYPNPKTVPQASS